MAKTGPPGKRTKRAGKRDTLTPRQSAFVAEYLKDLSSEAAALRAGYSPRTASSQGSQLLANPKIRKLIDEAVERRAARVEVKADDVLRELLRLAMVDIGRAYSANGTLLPIHEIPEEVRRAMAGLETEELRDEEGNGVGVVRKVKFLDKTKSLELLGKHLRLFVEKIEVEGKLTLEQLVQASIGGANR